MSALGISEKTIFGDLHPNKEYVIKIYRSKLATRSLIEEVDGYDQFSSFFSLRLNFAANPQVLDHANSDLPLSIE
jgi:hypothetical protein